jgi:hypothetical protein
MKINSLQAHDMQREITELQQFYRHMIGSSHSEESTVRFLCCYVEFLVLTISKQW